MFIKRSLKVFIIAIVAFAFASVGTAFAAANVVPESGAGEGEGTISGYTISAIHYTLAAGNPSNIASVSFNIAPTDGAGAPSASAIVVKIDTAVSTSCTLVGTVATCTISAPVGTASALTVIAAE